MVLPPTLASVLMQSKAPQAKKLGQFLARASQKSQKASPSPSTRSPPRRLPNRSSLGPTPSAIVDVASLRVNDFVGQDFMQKLQKAQGVSHPTTQIGVPVTKDIKQQTILQKITQLGNKPSIDTGITQMAAMQEARKHKYSLHVNPMQAATEQLMIKKSSKLSMNQFRHRYPNVELPTGEYDVVRVGVPLHDESGKLVRGFELGYSDVAKHKIKLAGGVENYKKYLNIVRSHPELPAIYNLSGGKGVGPLGILPTMGVDLAMASNRPGVAGASEREEVLITYLHRMKGSPEGGPTVKGMGMAIIESPYVAIAVGEAAPVLISAGGKALVRGGMRTAPHLFTKLPVTKSVVSKLISGTQRFGGKSGQSILQRQIPRNVLRWAREGYLPAVTTRPVVLSSKEASKRLFKTGASYIDDVGNVVLKKTNQPIGYVDDFNRVILYKPERALGFAKRTFISPERTKHFQKLLKKGVTTEGDVILRGEMGKNPWVQLQIMAEKSAYKKGLRGVKYPYLSKELKIRLSKYPKYVPDEAILTESEAFKKLAFAGKQPGTSYGPLYNVQAKAYREFDELVPLFAKDKLPSLKGASELFKQQKLLGKTKVRLPGDVTAKLTKKQIQSMRNIWDKRRWNPFTQQWDDVAAGSLVQQPTRRLISAEERSIVEKLGRGATVFGKGKSYGSLKPQFMMPVRRTGMDAFMLFLSGRGMTETDARHKLGTDIFRIPKVKQRKALVRVSMTKEEMREAMATGRLPAQVQEIDVKQQQFMEQMQKMAQIEDTVMFAPTVYDKPYPPVRRPGEPKKVGVHGFLIPPPLWFPGMGGKFASGGRASPYSSKYWDEYRATQRLLRDVIL